MTCPTVCPRCRPRHLKCQAPDGLVIRQHPKHQIRGDGLEDPLLGALNQAGELHQETLLERTSSVLPRMMKPKRLWASQPIPAR